MGDGASWGRVPSVSMSVLNWVKMEGCWVETGEVVGGVGGVDSVAAVSDSPSC